MWCVSSIRSGNISPAVSHSSSSVLISYFWRTSRIAHVLLPPFLLSRPLFARVSSSAILDLQGLHILFVCIPLLQTRCRINIREFRTTSPECIHDWRRFIFAEATGAARPRRPTSPQKFTSNFAFFQTSRSRFAKIENFVVFETRA
jgi:hypothetical protein